MIRFEQITVGYGKNALFGPATVEIPAGTAVALLGRNGTGKSSLLKTFLPHGPLLSGAIRIGGRELAAMDAAALSRSVAFVDTGNLRIPDLKCIDLVALGRSPYTDWLGRLGRKDREITKAALEAVGMAGFAGRSMDRLSDGECRKILIARAIAQDTPVLLLDEPTVFLDVPGKYEIAALLHRLAAEKGRTVLFSTHDLDLALTETDRILLLDPPRLLYSPTSEMRDSGLIEEVFGTSRLRRFPPENH